MDSEILNLLIVFVLVLLTAFFVGAEFAIVKVRRTRMEELKNAGRKSAEGVLQILDKLDEYLSACQLGITITALALGWVGEPALADLLEPLFHDLGFNNSLTHTLSFLIAFSIITFIHVVLGELAPKTMAIQKSEQLSLILSKPLILFYKLTYPVNFTLNGTANLFVRMIGFASIKDKDHHSEEEIKMILTNSPDIDPEEQEMFNRVFNFHDRLVREVMVHRRDMDCIYLEDELAETLAFVKESPHSRFPVCGEDKDDIVGYINVKDLYNQSQEGVFSLEPIIRNLETIYETCSLHKALRLLQEGHHQMAIVIDEYSGVSGLVTLEDLLEEIVGEIQDEFDDEVEPFQETTDGILIEGNVLVDDVMEQLGIRLEKIDGVDTIGGFIATQMEEGLKEGNTVEVEKGVFEIIDVLDRRILQLKFRHN
ncbi:HlyC/CorC family transporter (plasmid) [Pontibacillus sp. ALD_SL1]|uniref:hemolysin family protein n=1 Tax=Pontibacillus sp. ALD_SL1 TaxID=2777185 RepID=UPI001A960CF1|nr:hemolysin family protein [Pontibacillus sp. ALD_SL1]QST02336.1 HlyC/CorC family transporter [Pontibacillus sp. ALD_SL1]